MLIHGFASASVFFYRMLAPLSKKYRIVMFDSMAHGLNSHPVECSGVRSPAAAEAWQLEWMEKVIEACPGLPQKFLLSGHSHGGYLVSLYASQHPERVTALFLISPAGLMPYNADTYDPHSFLEAAGLMLARNPVAKRYPKQEVEQELGNVEKKAHPYALAHKMHLDTFKRFFYSRIRE